MRRSHVADARTAPNSQPPALFDTIAAAPVRYIKLGKGGCWEQRAIAEGRLYWSIPIDPVGEAARGDWKAAAEHYSRLYSSQGAATGALRELREFFTLGSDTLWITFTGGQMWWAFSEPAELIGAPASNADPAAFRRTIGPWRNTDRFGRPLDQATLSSKLTKVTAYRKSICRVEHADYALRRINGEEEAGVALLRSRRQALVDSAADLISGLHWRDFELLIDLVFAAAGWRRVTELGGTMKDIDLLLEQPITGERISVQVKSNIDQAGADRCVAAFEQSQAADRYFLVHHSGSASLSLRPGERPVSLWGCDDVAKRAIDAGLTTWLAARAG